MFLGVKVFDYEDYKFKIFNEFGRYSLLETKFKTLLLLPIEIITTWLLFRKKYNLAKNIVFWLYLNGFLFAIKIIFIPLYFPFISHKSFLDVSIQIIQYIVIFVHLILVFGNRKWLNVVSLFFVANLIYIIDNLLTGYLLFESQIYKQTGTKNIFELILKAYQP